MAKPIQAGLVNWIRAERRSERRFENRKDKDTNTAKGQLFCIGTRAAEGRQKGMERSVGCQ